MIYIFLLALAYSLIIGELKQGPIEPYWALFLAIFFVFFLIKKRTANIQYPIIQLFMVTMAGFALSTIFSRDIGFSLSTNIRLLSGMLALYVGSMWKNTNVHVKFSLGLLVLGGITAICSFFFLLFPQFATALPTMNLLFSSTGHNQAAYLWVFLLPLSIWFLYQNKRIGSILYLLIITAIGLSFSRGAWLMTAIYLLFLYITEKNTRWIQWILRISIGIMLILGISLVVLSFQPTIRKESLSLSPRLKAQLLKSPLTEEPRFYNWTQAIDGFRSNPIVGSGPGTFWLTSRQFQRYITKASAQTHNFALQTVSEVGLVGSIPFFLLFFVIGKQLLRVRQTEMKKTTHQNVYTISLIDGVLLSALYSNIEYNFDYLTLWVLLFITAGYVLTPHYQNKRHTHPLPILPLLAALILGLFGIITIIGNRLAMHANTFKSGYRLLSYNANRTERFLEATLAEKTPPTPEEVRLITLFHKDNPSILFQLALFDHLLFSPQETDILYARSIANDPLQKNYVAQYMHWLLQSNRLFDAITVYEAFIRRMHSSVNIPYREFNFHDAALLPQYTTEFALLLSGSGLATEQASKTLYILGLAVLPEHPKATKELWTMATSISPGWSLFYLELSSYYLYIEQNEQQSRHVLMDCLKLDSPREACREALDVFPNMGKPGTLQTNIRAIPKY